MDKCKKIGAMMLGGAIGLIAVFSAERNSKKEEAEKAAEEYKAQESKKLQDKKDKEQKIRDIEFYKNLIRKAKADIERYKDHDEKDGDEYWLELVSDEEDQIDAYETELKVLEGT